MASKPKYINDQNIDVTNLAHTTMGLAQVNFSEVRDFLKRTVTPSYLRVTTHEVIITASNADGPSAISFHANGSATLHDSEGFRPATADDVEAAFTLIRG